MGPAFREATLIQKDEVGEVAPSNLSVYLVTALGSWTSKIRSEEATVTN